MWREHGSRQVVEDDVGRTIGHGCSPWHAIMADVCEFTLTYPLLHHPAPPELFTGKAVAEVARAAEAAGFDALAFTEHPMPSDRWLNAGGHDALDPFIALTWAAAATERLRLLTNITVVAYRNPFLLAKTVATLDSLSGGRVILGAAAGYLKSEFRALGVDFDERNELFDEALEVLALTWAGEPVTYEGRHFSAAGNQLVPVPVQQPPPIWIGGNSTIARRRAATHGQGWMPFANPPQTTRVVRTASISNADDLAPLLDELSDLDPGGGAGAPRRPLRRPRRRHAGSRRLRRRPPPGSGRGPRRHRGHLGRRRHAGRRPRVGPPRDRRLRPRGHRPGLRPSTRLRSPTARS